MSRISSWKNFWKGLEHPPTCLDNVFKYTLFFFLGLPLSFWVCCFWFVSWGAPSLELQSQKSWWLIQQKLPDRHGTTGRSGRRRIFLGSTDVRDPLVGGTCQICHQLVIIYDRLIEKNFGAPFSKKFGYQSFWTSLTL